MNYIRLIRPHQWVKNFFCYAVFFFGEHYSLNNFIFSTIGFMAFCFISSSVYILNDIYDAPRDRIHVKKKHRPIAANLISVRAASLLCICLIITSCILAFKVSYIALGIILTYFIINIMYSIKLKNIVILDVFIISSGFLLRLLMGTEATGIDPSKWILLCTVMITLFLGFAKRKSELIAVSDGNITRVVLNDYSHLMLDIFLSMMAACSIMCYSLFIILGSNLRYIWITVPFVIFGIMRYIYILLLNDGGQDTSKDIIEDKQILLCCILFVISYGVVIFFLK